MDTAVGTDCSEAAALALLTAGSGGRLLGVVTSNRSTLSVPVIKAVNTYYGNAGIPVGEAKRSAPEPELWHTNGKWTEYVTESYPLDVSPLNSPDAVAVYRGILAGQSGNSVTIVCTGFLSNLRDLLISLPDDYSPKTGLELAAVKVRALYVVAGFAEGDRESNIEMDPAAAKYVMDNWPGDIYIVGRDMTPRLFTETLPDTTVAGSPLADIYRLSIRNDDVCVNSPFAPIAVLSALEGSGKYAKPEKGTLKIDDTGRDTWIPDKEGRHYRLISSEKKPAGIEKKVIEAMKRGGT